MSKSSKFAVITLTARQCGMLKSVIEGSLARMAENLAKAKDPAEIAFYQTTPAKFLPLKAQFEKAELDALRLKKPQKVKLSTEDFLSVLGSLHVQNQQEVRRLATLPEGPERQAQLDAYGEWQALDEMLDRNDPRLNDRSQDADPDEDEEDEEEA